MLRPKVILRSIRPVLLTHSISFSISSFSTTSDVHHRIKSPVSKHSKSPTLTHTLPTHLTSTRREDSLLKKENQMLHKDSVDTELSANAKKKLDLEIAEIFMEKSDHYGKIQKATPSVVINRFGDLLNRSYRDGSNLGEIAHIFKNFLKHSKPSESHWTLWLNAHRRLGLYDEALKIFYEMQDHEDIHLTTVPYNIVVDICCKQGDVEKAMTYISIMEKSRYFRPDIYTYSSVIHGKCAQGDFEGALKLLDRMRESSLKPGAANYAPLIDFLGQRGSLHGAIQLYEEMLKYKAKPTAVIYNILIKASAKRGNAIKAKEFLDAMRDQGFSPTEATIDALISGLGHAGNIEDAITAFEKVKYGQLGIPDQTPALAHALLDGIGSQLHAAQIAKEHDKIDEIMKNISKVYNHTLESGLVKSTKSRFQRNFVEESSLFVPLDCRPYRGYGCLVAVQYRLNQLIEDYIAKKDSKDDNWKRGLIIIVSSHPPEDTKPQREVVNDYLRYLRPPIFIQNKLVDDEAGEWDQNKAGSLIIAPPALHRYCHFKMQDREREAVGDEKNKLESETEEEFDSAPRFSSSSSQRISSRKQEKSGSWNSDNRGGRRRPR